MLVDPGGDCHAVRHPRPRRRAGCAGRLWHRHLHRRGHIHALLQATAPPGARGRVFAGFDLIWQLGRLASLALGGVTADTVGIPAVYAAGAVLLTVAAVIGWTGLAATNGP